MDTLLSPAETNALQNFLSSIDYHQDMSASEWAMYTQKLGHLPADEFLPPPPTQGSEALTKATKDLMALDASSWNAHSQQQTYDDRHHHREQPSYHPSYQQRRQSTYTRHETFPFLTNKMQQTQPPTLSLLPPNDISVHSTSPLSSSTSTTNTPATPHTPFAFGNFQSAVHPKSESQPAQKLSSSLTKRSSSSAPLSSASAKRIKSSPTASAAPSTNGAPKQTLLSPSQKKANHIQSEQKRRANIRRGYEALCDTVPALREAIREEEEAESRLNMGLGSLSKNSRSKRKKRDAGESIEKEKDKIDGRAGPRSENVVLSKTIEYINQLLSERSALLARLHRARSCLPSGHPVSVPVCLGEPLWERNWKGGEGKIDGENNDEEEENDFEEGEST